MKKEVEEFYCNLTFTEDRIFDTKVKGVQIHLIGEVLAKILQVEREGIYSIAKGEPTRTFILEAEKFPDLSGAGTPRKFLKGRYQLYFEFINKVLLPRYMKRSVATTVDLYLMEALRELESLNLPALMMEHITKIMTVKDGNHGLGYGYLLNKVFAHFRIKLDKGVLGIIKQAFPQNTSMECECIEVRTGNKANSQI